MEAINFFKNIPAIFGDQTFMIDAKSDVRLSYASMDNAACSVGNFLNSQGFQKGDRLIVFADGAPEVVKLYFGCMYSGIVVVPVNPSLSDEQVNFIIKDSKATGIVATSSYSERKSLLESNLKLLTLTGDEKKETNLLDQGKLVLNPTSLCESQGFASFNGMKDSDDLIVIYTSGTTSDPKGVVHRISSLVNNGRSFIERLSIGPQNRFLNLLPITFLGGYYNLMLLPYLAGASVVLTDSFNAVSALRFWGSVVDHKVNTLWLVPTIMSILMEMDRGNKGIEYCKDNIILSMVGTDFLSTELRVAFTQKYKIELHENYGLSETLFIATHSPKEKIPKASVGKIVSNVEVKIVDNEMKDVAVGENGEILVKTPFLLKEYIGQEIPMEGEWFTTGDMGKVTEENYLYISGRKKDLIIRGGINVSPALIEKVVCKQLDILECAVVGLPHKIMGEEIIAVVRTELGVDFKGNQKALLKIINKDLSASQKISSLEKLNEFPRTSSGKIQKTKIRMWLTKMREGDFPEGVSVDKVLDGKVDEINYFQPAKTVADSIEAMSITYNNMVYEMKRKGEDVITLSLGEAFFDIPLMSFDDLPFPAIYHYSHSRGVPELRECLAKYFMEHYEVSFDPETEIIVTAGSKIGIHMTMMAILNPGDEAIIPEPAWVSYPEQVKLCHGVPVQVPYDVEVFDYERYITNRTKIIIINNPHNPSGKIYSLEELTFLCKLAEKYNLFILSDEVYSDFVLDPAEFTSIGNLDPKKKRLIICNSISKNYGISGWRLGYVISNAAFIQQLIKLNQHMITCPPTILQYYIAKYFFDIIKITTPQIQDVIRRRNELSQYMKEIRLTALPGTSTFYHFVSIGESSLDSQEFCTKLLLEHKIATVPGIGYGKSCDRFIRVSVGAEPQERNKLGLDAIKKLIGETTEKKNGK